MLLSTCKTHCQNLSQTREGFIPPPPSQSHASASGRPWASGRVLEKKIGPSWRQAGHQDRQLERKTSILDPSWRQLCKTSYNIAAKTPPNTENITKTPSCCSILHSHLCPRRPPKCSPRPPKTSQIEAKIEPRLHKLSPRRPS